jgi:hypothetical protein
MTDVVCQNESQWGGITHLHARKFKFTSYFCVASSQHDVALQESHRDVSSLLFACDLGRQRWRLFNARQSDLSNTALNKLHYEVKVSSL